MQHYVPLELEKPEDQRNIAILEKHAVREYITKNIKGLPKVETIEVVEALLNALYLKNADINKHNKIKISNTKHHSASTAINVNFGFREVQDNVKIQFEQLVCKEENGKLMRDDEKINKIYKDFLKYYSPDVSNSNVLNGRTDIPNANALFTKTFNEMTGSTIFDYITDNDLFDYDYVKNLYDKELLKDRFIGYCNNQNVENPSERLIDFVKKGVAEVSQIANKDHINSLKINDIENFLDGECMAKIISLPSNSNANELARPSTPKLSQEQYNLYRESYTCHGQQSSEQTSQGVQENGPGSLNRNDPARKPVDRKEQGFNSRI